MLLCPPPQGDHLAWLLSAALRHDCNYMHASMGYRENRDRVITMGLELHEKALAVHRHRPEFSLTYPNYDPMAKWNAAMNRAERLVRFTSHDP